MNTFEKQFDMSFVALRLKIDTLIEALPTEQRTEFDKIYNEAKNKLAVEYSPLTEEEEKTFEKHFSVPKG